MNIHKNQNEHSKTIYLLRHGESVDNARPVFQSPAATLTSKGIEQCLKTAEMLQADAIGFDGIISSSLVRATESAQLLKKALDLPLLRVSDDLVERKSPSSVHRQEYANSKAASTWDRWDKCFYKNERVEDGEISAEIIARAKNFLASILTEAQSSTLVVTHGYFIRVIVAVALLGDALDGDLLNAVQDSLMTDNMALTTLTYSEDYKGILGWKVKDYNRTITAGTGKA